MTLVQGHPFWRLKTDTVRPTNVKRFCGGCWTFGNFLPSRCCSWQCPCSGIPTPLPQQRSSGGNLGVERKLSHRHGPSVPAARHSPYKAAAFLILVSCFTFFLLLSPSQSVPGTPSVLPLLFEEFEANSI